MGNDNILCQSVIDKAFKAYTPYYREIIIHLTIKEDIRNYLISNYDDELKRFELFVKNEINDQIENLARDYKSSLDDLQKYAQMLTGSYGLKLNLEYSRAIKNAFNQED